MKRRLIETLATKHGKDHLRKMIKKLDPKVNCDRMNLSDCKDCLERFSYQQLKEVRI